MLNSETQIYLGDLLTTSGKINENIISRYNKRIGKVSVIIGILQEVSFGQQYFKMALLFCNSFLLCSMLFSSKVLYEITNAHIEKLEPVDRICFRNVLHVPNSNTAQICAKLSAHNLAPSLPFTQCRKLLNAVWGWAASHTIIGPDYSCVANSQFCKQVLQSSAGKFIVYILTFLTGSQLLCRVTICQVSGFREFRKKIS